MSSRLAILALILAVVCAVAAIASGLGYRFGIWDLDIGFGMLQWSAYGAVAAAVLAVVAAILTSPRHGRRGFAAAAVALLVAAPVFGYPLYMLRQASHAPNIHDITTDPDNPPPFVAILPLRASAPNSAQYQGASVATQQRRAYPAIRPFDSSAPPDVAFARALAVARDMGWQIVADVPAQGRIEATDTTRWFGFKDDIVVRVTPRPGGSRVDVRSESRVGTGDIGTNARRIDRYLHALSQAT